MTHIDATLHAPVRYADLILAALERRPQHIAFDYRSDSRTNQLSYGDVALHIRRLSTALRTMQVADSNGIALLTGPSPEAEPDPLPRTPVLRR